MCDPVSAMVGLTIGAGALDFVGGMQQASAQESANNASRDLAIRNQNLQIQALNNQAEEDAKVTADKMFESNRAAREQQATARVSSGEAGVSGLSVDALLGDFDRQAGENSATFLQSLSFADRQRQIDRESIGITTQSQINQLPFATRPSLAGAIVKTGANAFQTNYAMSKTTKIKASDITWD